MSRQDKVIPIPFLGGLREDLPPEILPKGGAFTKVINCRRNREGELESRKIYTQEIKALPSGKWKTFKALGF